MEEDRHDRKLARWAREGRAGTPPVPAATVVLLREGAEGLETLMLRRSSKIAFAGLWVFPGGRVDEGDLAGLDPEDDLAAARVAAAREAREETGLEIDPAALVPFSHWTPPPITPRRFLTWFFLAAAPAAPVRIDHGEIREHAWMSARGALSRRDAAEIELAPPTFVTLHALSQRSGLEDALRHASARPPERFATRIALTDAGPVAIWHGDAGWEDGDPDRPGGRHRLSMFAEGWRYERRDD